jgi:hypothetical protein
MAINDRESINGVPDRGYFLYLVSKVIFIVTGLFVIGPLAVRLAC